MSKSDDEDCYWDSELRQWVYPSDVEDALNAATLAIDSYYNEDRDKAIRWLLRAHEVNK